MSSDARLSSVSQENRKHTVWVTCAEKSKIEVYFKYFVLFKLLKFSYDDISEFRILLLSLCKNCSQG